MHECGDLVAQRRQERRRVAGAAHWAHKLSCVGMVMGMGSMWRCPALAYEHGRGAFMACYVAMTFVLAMPLCQLEIAVSQFSGTSIKALWKCMPLGRGIGVAACYCSALTSVYNALVVAYATLYLCNSLLYDELPWTACGPAWGADAACYGLRDAQSLCGRSSRPPVYLMSGLLAALRNGSRPEVEHLRFPAIPFNDTLRCRNASQPASEQFFYKRVLSLSEGGFGHFGRFQMDLVAYLGAVWIMVFFNLCGIAKFSSKLVLAVVLASAACYLLVTTRFLLLDNAAEGLHYLFSFHWKSFANVGVWYQAAQHSVFTLGAWFGPLHYLSCRSNFFDDTGGSHVFLAASAVLSNVAGCVMSFSALGHLAALRGSAGVPDVDRAGQAVPFVTLPMALGTLTFPRLASSCFFAAFIFLSFTAQMSLVNAALQEMLVEVEARLPSKKLLVTLIFCILCFLLSCLLSSQNGLYAMNLLDAYVGGLAVPIVALYGVVAITWIYGPHNVARDIEFIHGTPVHSVTMLLWKFVCPIILLLTALSPLAAFDDMAKIGAYAYPLWASVMGCLVVIGCLVIIAGACLAAYRKHNRNVQEAVRPNRLWGPKDPMLMDAYRHVRRSSLRRQLALAVLDTDT